MTGKIPKIIHQIWIGPNHPPLGCMSTWKNKNPDFQYILWNETELEKQNIIDSSIKEKIDLCNEYCGKTDILRLLILYIYGGIFIDADSICIEPITELFQSDKYSGFATYENENTRKGLVANGNLAVIPNYPLIKDMLDWIRSDESTVPIKTNKAWAVLGPVLLTRFLNTNQYPDFMVFPSYTFLPVHFTGIEYRGHRKVYAHQLWGSNYGLYTDSYKICTLLPECFHYPKQTILISVDLTGIIISSIWYLLDSLKRQEGYFGIECIFYGTISNKSELEIMIFQFINSSRFIHIHIMENRPPSTIDIHPNCILFANTLDDIMRVKKSVNVPIYRAESDGYVFKGENFTIVP